MSDLQNQIISLRRKVSLLENNVVVFNVEPRNPGSQTIWVDTETREAKYWNGENWIVTGSTGSGVLTDWNTSVVFSSTDYRTIEWTAGVMSLGTALSKSDYATTSGNFTMTTTTYFYWQPDSPTSIQATTTPGNVVIAGGIMIAIGRMNPDVTSKASIKIFGGPSPDQIIADEIVANSITSNMIQANSISAAKISTLSMAGKSCVFDTGTVGGWTMGTTSLSATNAGNTTTLSSGATAFSAGPTGSPTVTITQAGALTATSATITGAITTGAGSSLDGTYIAVNSISAAKISVASLSAISANIGNITAGSITGVNIVSSSGGQRITLTNGDALDFYYSNTNIGGFYSSVSGLHLDVGTFWIDTGSSGYSYFGGNVSVTSTLTCNGKFQLPVGTNLY